MRTVRFLERRTVDYLDGAGEQVYEAGSVHTFRDDKAQRWVTRNAAVYFEAKPPEEAADPRAELAAALAALPGEYTDPDFVVNGMRGHFGVLFTEEDEATVRNLVKASQGVSGAVNPEAGGGSGNDNAVVSAADLQGKDDARAVGDKAPAGSAKPAEKKAPKAGDK
jgi:hypothetical protein